MTREFHKLPQMKFQYNNFDFEFIGSGDNTLFLKSYSNGGNSISVRGIPHNVSCHIELDDSGNFTLQGTLTARDAREVFGPEATPAARREILKIVTEAAKAFHQENPGFILQGNFAHLSNTIYRLDSEINKATTALNDLTSSRDHALARLETLSESLSEEETPSPKM